MSAITHRDRLPLAALPLVDPRFEAFAQHFCANGGNSPKAMRSAGYSGEQARAYGRRLLNTPAVTARIRYLNEQQFAEVGVTAVRVKEALAQIAFADIRQLYDENDDLLPPSQWPDEVASAVASLDVEIATGAAAVRRRKASGEDPLDTEDTEAAPEPVVLKKVRLADRMAALTLLARHFKIVGSEAEDGMNALAGALADRLNRAKQRVADDVTDAVVIEDNERGPVAVEVIEASPATEPAEPAPQEPQHEQLW